MKNKFLLALLLLCPCAALLAQTYITNVTVVDVEKKRLIPNQTVVVTGNEITDIKKSNRIRVPENAQIVDGSEGYLIPGMVDAHIHFFQNGGLYARPDVIDLRAYQSITDEVALTKSDMEGKLRRYLKNGITTVIDVGSTYSFLEQRKEFTDKSHAPNIYVTGPLLTTYKPSIYEEYGPNDTPFTLTTTVEEGIAGVQEQLEHNPDFIKIWYIAGADGLSVAESAQKNLPIVKGIIEEAHRNNLKVAVHATQRVTAQLAVENGADFLVHSVDDEVLQEDFIQLMKQNEVVLCPTLIVSAGYTNTFGQRLEFSAHELQNADPYQLGSLLDLRHLSDTTVVEGYRQYANAPTTLARGKRTDSISKINLKLLSDAGVTIATGTDAGNIGTLHASSYLSELQAMQQSGMSNWKILEASTLNGAKILDLEDKMGSVAVGKTANLVLLNANPIADLKNLTQINTIINKGEVINPKELLKDSPEDLAQRQLNAYNLRDIDGFLEPYAEDVEVYSFPNTLLYTGKEIMRQQYSGMFANTPNLHCELKGRIVQGNVVIDQERVRFGSSFVEAIAIYHIEDGKIKKVYFVQ
ncbi:Imidazolonepropionase [Robiginitalea myxolifaciens]|uniref:Imidazolonepropionase n=1 Tax=Robiginitalea myxolifaciens TaxID=400055 RepID=A0A1I6HC56_9FLAO|nr:amidohydrolase family protein [Robiginitalea myxolifaciens]SFR51867.1 Imidazolonepropionase [Robiginitalea myxolifaciens]